MEGIFVVVNLCKISNKEDIDSSITYYLFPFCAAIYSISIYQTMPIEVLKINTQSQEHEMK